MGYSTPGKCVIWASFNRFMKFIYTKHVTVPVVYNELLALHYILAGTWYP